MVLSKTDALLYSRICEGKRFYYSIREDGVVIKTSKVRYIESQATPYSKRGKATVKVNQCEYTLKNLVALHFIKGYKTGTPVEVIDGNPFNCSVENLRVYTYQEHGRRTGHLSRSRKVTANGVEYRSVRACARALHASYQTVLDYMSGSVNHSVLRGINISREESL